MPFYTFLEEGSPTKIDYRKKGTLVLTSLLEDLDDQLAAECINLFGLQHQFAHVPRFGGPNACLEASERGPRHD